MHSLLARQLSRLSLTPGSPPPPGAWRQLLEEVGKAYGAADDERRLLEDSLKIASAEMRELDEHFKASNEARYRELFENADDVIYTVALDGRFTSINRAGERLSGYGRDELIGEHYSKVVAPESVPLVAAMTQRKLNGEGEVTRFEVEIVTPSGSRIPVELSTRLVYANGQPVEIQGMGRDIRERREHERRLRHLATHDPLTGLPNRHLLEEELSRAVRAAARGEHSVLMFLDLDNFKLVNDSLGHAAGDQVLVEMARALSQALSPTDILVRIGGDEFGVLFRSTDVDRAVETAERLRSTIEQKTFVVDGHSFYLSISSGLVLIDGQQDPSLLLSRADGAMYLAKERGRNRVLWSRSDDNESARMLEANLWISRIKHGLDEGRFEVYYQPVVHLKEHRVDHFEALVRLRDRHGEMVTPNAFVAAAERFGLMSQVDRFVVEHVIARLVERPDLRVFLNLSSTSIADEWLREGMIRKVRDAGVGARLGFEITEAAVVNDFALTEAWMTSLRQEGCRFALDDFGIGFNSLSYVRRLPFDHLKIDGSFVRSLPNEPKQRALVGAIQTLAEILGLETVAESIENPAILEAVREMGITYGQGYLLGKPSRRLRRPAVAADAA